MTLNFHFQLYISINITFQFRINLSQHHMVRSTKSISSEMGK